MYASFPGHTSRQPNLDISPCTLAKTIYLFDKTKYPVFTFLTNRTGIKDNDISFFPSIDFRKSCLSEEHMNLFTISMVHLATKGLNMKFLLKCSRFLE
jgi:hypothetical protein